MTTDGFTTCLWFDGQAEEAAHYYVSIFKNSSIGRVGRNVEGGAGPAGSVLAVEFTANGQKFVALNGGPQFKFNEAVSLIVYCDSQQEIDYFWEKLGAGGDPAAQACGWLKDKYGVSWQIVPIQAMEMWKSGVSAKSERAMKAMMQMKKLDIAALQKAYDGVA